MLGEQQVVAFVGATDLDRSTAFYRDVLQLTLVERNAFAAVFDAGGTMLRVTAVAGVVPAGYTVLGWRVTDIRAQVEALAVAGVSFLRFEGMPQDALGIWTTPGSDRVAWFADPDGNTLSLTQLASPPDEHPPTR